MVHSACYYTSKEHRPRGCSTHSSLSPQQSFNNKCHTDSSTGQFDGGGIFSIKYFQLSFQCLGFLIFSAPKCLASTSLHSLSSRFKSVPFHTFCHPWWYSYDSCTSNIFESPLTYNSSLFQYLFQDSDPAAWWQAFVSSHGHLNSAVFILSKQVPYGRHLHTLNFNFLSEM